MRLFEHARAWTGVVAFLYSLSARVAAPVPLTCSNRDSGLSASSSARALSRHDVDTSDSCTTRYYSSTVVTVLGAAYSGCTTVRPAPVLSRAGCPGPHWAFEILRLVKWRGVICTARVEPVVARGLPVVPTPAYRTSPLATRDFQSTLVVIESGPQW
eukprot:3932354-Rhodomonas_salina.1